LTGLLLWSVAPVLAGWSSTVVMSNSMAPRLLAGDVVLIRPVTPDELALGQILLVDDPDHAGRLRLHRLAAMDSDTGALTLKGDANARADSTTVQTGSVHGVAALRVPWVGSPLVWLHEGRTPLVAATAAALTALAVGAWCYRPLPRVAPAPTHRTCPSAGAPGRSTGPSRPPVGEDEAPQPSGTVLANRTDTRPLYRASDLVDGPPDRHVEHRPDPGWQHS
jgi:signal peptidase